MDPNKRILITGANGQVGTDLTAALRARRGPENVVAIYHRSTPPEFRSLGPSEYGDVIDHNVLRRVIERYDVGTIFHLAAVLSGDGEIDPNRAWVINVDGLKNVLDLAIEFNIGQVFWPSSIAVFGPSSPPVLTPQHTVLEPTTMYGITKLIGEQLCHYYWLKFKLDVRSIRYPGLINYKTFSGGGTSDYSVEMFIEARKHRRYTCFVRSDTQMPLLYMDDAIKATLQLMDADPKNLTVRTSYNLGGLDFTAGDLAKAIGREVDGFVCEFIPDFRQAIADSWPTSVDDSAARKDWGWAPEFDLQRLVDAMMSGVATMTSPSPKER
jgi:nucleoside-diphosphate-sugar epimerase